MTAADRLAFIESNIAKGRTIMVSTATKAWEVSPKTAAKWAAAGATLFKVSGASLYMARGRGFDCIDFAKVQAI